MADMFYLTGEDVALFREMAQEFRARKKGMRDWGGPPKPPQAPEVYLAKVPPGGIPALSQSATTGTGTDQPLDDVAGEVECEIYQLDPETGEFGRVGELTYIVHNLAPSAISANRTPWVLVVRDKFGEWFVAGGAATANSDGFEEIVQTVNVVTAVVSRECGLTVRNTPFTFTFTLPVGSDVVVTAGGSTGTGTADDGDDTLIDFPTQLIDIPTSAAFAFDSATCTGTITFTTTPICVFSGGLECCPDYTGTGTS